MDRECQISAIAKEMKVSTDYAQKYRKRLLDAGVIKTAGRGKVEFAIPYIKDYLASDE